MLALLVYFQSKPKTETTNLFCQREHSELEGLRWIALEKREKWKEGTGSQRKKKKEDLGKVGDM